MEQIAEIFNEVQDSTSISTRQIYSLLDVFYEDKNVFFEGMEQCFLKIIKSLLKAGKNLTIKFEKMAEKLFSTAYEQYKDSEQEKPKKNKKKKEEKQMTQEDLFALFSYFITFFTEGLESPGVQIRMFCARILFFLLKQVTSEELGQILDLDMTKLLVANIVALLRDKKPLLKKIGIKLSSYLQYLAVNEDFAKLIEILKHELLKIMCTDEDDNSRNDAITNLDLNDGTFSHLVRRVRDKSLVVRQTVFRKLIKEEVQLGNLPELCDIYKLIYDGLGARDQDVKNVCIRYLALNYKMFQKEEEKYRNNHMDEEDGGKNDQIRQKLPQTPNKDQAYRDTKILIQNFLSTFELEKTLFYPHLYQIMELMMKELVKSDVFSSETFPLYLREFLGNQMNIKKQKQLDIDSNELFLLRVICEMLQDPEERKLVHLEIQSTIEECFPNGVDFCSIIEYFAKEQNLMGLQQSLLLGQMLINSDETGRDMLQKTLENICLNYEYFEESLPDNEVHNDVMKQYTQQDYIKQQFSSPYYEAGVIMNSNDLLPLIITIFKKLIPNSEDFSRKILALITQVKEPLEKSEDESGMIIELQEFQERIQKLDDKIIELSEEIKSLKSKKANSTKIFKAEKEKSDCKQHKDKLINEQEELKQSIEILKVKTLIISQALFMNAKVNINEPSVMNLLKMFIIPHLEDESGDLLKTHASKAVALFVLTDKKICEGYTSIYTEYLQQYEESDEYQETQGWHIISIKAITDFNMMYDFTDTDSVDIIEIANMFLRIAFKAEMTLRTLAVEGLCKLIISKKIKEPNQYLCALLILWFDHQVVLKSGFKILQILTAFFKNYQNLDLQNIQRYEESVEILLTILVSLKKDMDFNPDFIGLQINQAELIQRFLRVSIDSICYEKLGEIYEKETTQINPLEKLFMFICLKVSKGSVAFTQLFAKFAVSYDFVEKLTLQNLLVVQNFFDSAFDKAENVSLKDAEKFKKVLEVKIKKEQEKEDNNEVDGIKIQEMVEKLQNQFSSTSLEAARIIKNLTDFQLIVSQEPGSLKMDENQDAQDILDQVFEEYQRQPTSKITKNTKKGRKQLESDDDDEEQESDNQNSDNNDQDQNDNDDNDDNQEEEEEVIKPKNTKIRIRRQPNKKRAKEIQSDDDINEDESNDEEQNQEEENQKDSEEEQDNQDDEEEIQPTKITRSKKQTKKQTKKQNNKAGKNKKQAKIMEVEQEESEQEQEQNEDNEEDENENEEENEHENEEEEEEEDNDNDVEVSEQEEENQKKRSTRSSRSQDKKNQKVNNNKNNKKQNTRNKRVKKR